MSVAHFRLMSGLRRAIPREDREAPNRRPSSKVIPRVAESSIGRRCRFSRAAVIFSAKVLLVNVADVVGE
jgi:hypothetical protein